MPTGTVCRLWRWPVKSMAGEEARALSLGPRGVGGDRGHAVLHEHKGAWRPLTAREAPGLLAWRAAYPFDLDAALDPANPPYAIVTEPAGVRSWRWGDPHLRSALERDLGRAVRLERDPGGIPDVAGTVLVTVAATLAALSRELGAEVDPRRFRTNLHLELDCEPWAELGWAGAAIELGGGVRMIVDGPCERCAIPTRDPDTREKWPGLLRHLAAEHGQDFGVLARVSTPRRVAAGEAVLASWRPEIQESRRSADKGLARSHWRKKCCASTRRPRRWWPLRPEGWSPKPRLTARSCWRSWAPHGRPSPRSWASPR